MRTVRIFRNFRLAVLAASTGALVSTSALVSTPALASSGVTPMSRLSVKARTPQEEAQLYFEQGVGYRDKADKLEAEAASEPDAGKKAKLEKKAQDKYRSAVKKLEKATEKDPSLFQAWGSLGYARRKSGDHEGALEAYDKSLELRPNYSPAIEYRAEAYLGLGRLDDVKSAYMMLFNIDRARADELEAAIQKWLAERKANPAGVAPDALEEFSTWAAQRRQLASQSSLVTNPEAPRW